MAEKSVDKISPRKFKRIVSFDFLRGCAILGVMGFHVLAFTYDFQAVLADDPPVPYYFLVIILGFAGSLVPLFFTVSAVSNTFSMEKRIQKALGSNPDKENMKRVCRNLQKTQVLRGSFVVFIGYFGEGFFNHGLAGILFPEDTVEVINNLTGTLFYSDAPTEYTEEIIENVIGTLLHSNVVSTIGFGVIISSMIYLALRKRNLKEKTIILILSVLAVVTILITPVMNYIFQFLPNYWVQDSNSELFLDGSFLGGDLWESQTLGWRFYYFALSPWVIGWFPLFPDLAFFYIGIVIGLKLVNGGVTQKNIRFIFGWSAILFLLGLIWYIITNDIVLSEPLFYDRFTNDMLFPGAGSLTVMAIILYYGECRGYGNNFAKKTKFFRRFGIMSLTIMSSQWLMVFPLKLINFAINLANRSNISFIDGPIFNQGLSGYASWGVFFVIVIFWWALTRNWEALNFICSLEWWTGKILSIGNKHKSDKLDMGYLLRNVESVVAPEEGNRFYKWYNFILVYLWLIINMLGVAVPLLL